MFNNQQFREYIIRPALNLINLYSEAAEELLVATCAQETEGGTYLHQVKGPALGPYQIEPATHDDIWKTTLNKNGKLTPLGYAILKGCRFVLDPPADVMVYNLYYATMMARIFYYRCPEALPDPNDIQGIWDLYKKRWNTEKGAATQAQFYSNYHNFTGKTIAIHH